jgi:hypothetical protein
MSSFWTGVLAAGAVIVAMALGSGYWMQRRINADVATPLSETNPGGTAGTALIVYQPGLSDFQAKVSAGFGDGLAEAGWRVFTTTASDQAPSALAGYDLVVLGAPVYGGAPGKPLSRYIERVADFGGKPVVVLLTAGSDAGPAIELTEQAVAGFGGRPTGSLGLTTNRPNDAENEFTGSNAERAVQIARRAGRTLQLPAS